MLRIPSAKICLHILLIMLLFAVCLGTTGCEFLLGDAAIGVSEITAIGELGDIGMGVEGMTFEDSIGKDVVGPEDAPLPRSPEAINEFTTRMGTEWGEGRAASTDFSGPLANDAQALAQKSIGSEPVEGIVEHFDMQRNYMGKTVVTEKGGANFNANGVETGYLKRFPARTNLWDINKNYRGSSVPRGNTTVISDAQGNVKGYSTRINDLIRTYNETNTQVGYSQIHPMTQRALGAIPVDLGGLFVRHSRTGTNNSSSKSILRATQGHFEFFNCCVLKLVYRVTNPEDSVPVRSGMWPRMHPYVGTPANEIPGTQIQVYNYSNLGGDFAMTLNPGQSRLVDIQLPIEGSMMRGFERLTQDQLNVAGCRLMATVRKDWSGFSSGNGVVVLPLPCPPSQSGMRPGAH
jgi:hypothetical protein